MSRTVFLAALLIVGGLPGAASAQYFGQNKVQFDKFEFRVLETEHFDIHYYPSEADAAKQVALMAERWYTRLSKVLTHELTGRQAVVLYASHPEFEQTNVIEGMIDEGTGGVTEGLRRRVVLPLAATLGETDHVLGHELVHAFQYDILGLKAGPAPLWFVEGMAEYLSLGPRSVLTAMWLRDSAIENTLPAIRDLDDPRYFPYRYGHAFWAYIGGRYGDAMIGTILHRLSLGQGTGGLGPIAIIEGATGVKEEQLSAAWKESILAAYDVTPRERPKEHAKAEAAASTDGLVIGEATGSSSLNVGPALSPDGSKIAFLSGRGRLSIDLYVADARTGKVIRSLTKSVADPHFQSLQFIASAGAWSPDSRRLAVGTVRQGRAVLAVFDVDTGAILQEIGLGRAGEIFQPTWSPDGKSVAFSAQVGGFTDLYLCDLGTKEIRRLTNDQFANLQPVWTADGRKLIFVTDQYSSRLDTLSFGNYGLAQIDVASGQTSAVETGLSGNVFNPQTGPDAGMLFFIGDATGRPEVYRLDLATGRAVMITNAETGVAGITPLSPAISVAQTTGRAAFNLFRDSGYELHFIEPGELGRVAADQTADRDYAVLPPTGRASSVVADSLAQPRTGLPDSQDFPNKTYSPKLSLLTVGQSVGLSTGGYGTYAAGGVSMVFSDLLGNHIVSTGVQVNGGVKDVAAQVAYYNRASRWNWGVFGQRIPLLAGTVQAGYANINNQLVYVEQTLFDRQTYSEIGGSVAYPLSRASRVEFSLSGQHIGFTQEVETLIYDQNGNLLNRQTEDLPGVPGLTMAKTAAAFVRDTSAFGLTSPILGERMRFEVAPMWGDLRITDFTADYRRYFMPVRPVTLAARVLHFGHYGSGSEDPRLSPLFLGYSSLVRGYDPNSFEPGECTPAPDGSCPQFDRLLGSRLLVVNAELRVPAAGLFSGNLSYGAIPVELFTFYDGGVAWTRDVKPAFAGGSRDWVSTAGVGARVNAFGYLIAEFNMAHPLDRPGRGWLFVFNLRPGF